MNSKRLFKQGDRVQKKTGGPVLTVQRYINEYNPWIGWHKSKNTVECSFWHSRKGYQKILLHQNNLVKLSNTKNATFNAHSHFSNNFDQTRRNQITKGLPENR